MCCLFNGCSQRRCCRRRCCCERVIRENDEFARRLREETRYIYRNIYHLETQAALTLDNGSTVFSNKVWAEKRYFS